jgi:hypothetical protein
MSLRAEERFAPPPKLAEKAVWAAPISPPLRPSCWPTWEITCEPTALIAASIAIEAPPVIAPTPTSTAMFSRLPPEIPSRKDISTLLVSFPIRWVRGASLHDPHRHQARKPPAGALGSNPS